MTIKKFRWSKVYESSEEELVAFLQSRSLQAERITAEASNVMTEQTEEHQMTMWCAEGSLVVRLGSSTTSLQPGDALALYANVRYELLAGMTGYVCYRTTQQN